MTANNHLSKNFGAHSFGQEFYPYESLRAIKIAEKSKTNDRALLVRDIAATLPQSSDSTRQRIAHKFVQRYIQHESHTTGHGAINGTARQPAQAQPFVRLVARNRHVATQIELLFYRLSRVDTLVGLLARELFFPVCVQERAPDRLSRAEFSARNGGQLFAVTPQLTRHFIFHYAEEFWNFTDRASLDRALRVLQSAGLIARERMTELRGHPTAFRLSEHNISTVTFLYALYDEFLPHLQSSCTNSPDASLMLSKHVLPIADFARTFLLSPAQVEEHCEIAHRHQLLTPSHDQVRLVFGNMNALVDALLSKAI